MEPRESLQRHPDFVAVGHVTKDLLASGESRLGGTVSYASVTAARLGLSAAVCTSAARDFDFASLLDGIESCIVSSRQTTTFENIYHGESRCQRLLGRAAQLRAFHLPPEWRKARVALLGPVANEVATDWLGACPCALLGATAQGWLRSWDRMGRVRAKPWPAARWILPRLDVLVVSETDVAQDDSVFAHYAGMVRLLVITRGSRGCTVCWKGQRRQVEACPAILVDPTGAGDVFAAAFLVRLLEVDDPVRAAEFASSAASLSIEGHGLDGIPTRSQVERRLSGWPASAR
jgi:1D-myo-inositol 3-kinase